MTITQLNASRNTNYNHLAELPQSDLDELPSFSTYPVTYVATTDKGLEHRTSATKRVVYNNLSGDLVHVAGKDYNAKVQPLDGIQAVERLLLDSGVNLEGVSRSIDTSHNGGRLCAAYTLPNYTLDLGNGDETQFQLLHRNSWDGSWTFTVEVGAIRIACTNGQVALDNFCVYSAKHTPRLDPEHAKRKIETALKTFEAEGERWKKWKSLAITHKEALDMFTKVAGCNEPYDAVTEAMDNKRILANKTVMYLWNQFQDEIKNLGMNQWAAYNAMTHWSTHAPAGKKSAAANIVSTRVARNKLVRQASVQMDKAA